VLTPNGLLMNPVGVIPIEVMNRSFSEN